MDVGRASWDTVWADVAESFAVRSLCSQSQVAAVIVTADNRVASVGYNGPPAGLNLTERCEQWCPRGRDPGTRDGRNYGLSCLSVHAEVNAIMRADWKDMQGGTIYCTRTPCQDCAKVIAGCGVARAEFPILKIDAGYEPDATCAFLKDAGIRVRESYDKIVWKIP